MPLGALITHGLGQPIKYMITRGLYSESIVSPVASHKLYVDWNNDGITGEIHEDVTDYLLSISWRRGRDHASTLTGQTTSLSFTAELDNRDGRFNSFLATGPMYGLLLPGRMVRFVSTFSGATTTQFTGYLTSIQLNPELGGGHTATISGFGPLGKIARQSVSIALQINKDTGTIIDAILDAAGWPTDKREIDRGATVVPYYFTTEKRNVLDLIREIEASEGGVIYETKDGKIGFESRMRRRMPPYNASKATLSDADGAVLAYDEIEQSDPVDEIYNLATAKVQRYELQEEAVLWKLAETDEASPTIAPGASKSFWASISPDVAAVYEWTTPVASTDFTANTNSFGTGTDLSASITVTVDKFATSMKITLTNGAASTVSITSLSARGVALVALDPVTVRADDEDSQETYGIREFPLDAPWLPSTNIAQGYVDDTVSDRKDPKPLIAVGYRANRSTPQLIEALTRDVGHRITVEGKNRALLGVDEDFYVESITQTILQAGTDHRVKYELSPATIVEVCFIIGESEIGGTDPLLESW